jgi:8-oxo-dGTP pyrophosphatase MutT (NUDIX family)
VRRGLADRNAERIPEYDCGIRAAVALILRDGPEGSAAPEALFVRRARVEGDPWSGHMALPGGRAEQSDADLLDTACRETREETGLVLRRADCLGRLAEIHPRSPHLPPICVTPFVAHLEGAQEPRLNHELAAHVWIPVSVLSDPSYRSTLVRVVPSTREFPTIEFGGHVIWGLTFAILEDFLEAVDAGRTGSPS